MITQGEVNVGKAFGIKKIEKFFMEIVPNQHAKAYLVGMATDFGAYDQWKNTKECPSQSEIKSTFSISHEEDQALTFVVIG